MKNILMLLCLCLLGAVSVHGQVLAINNNTSCGYNLEIYVQPTSGYNCGGSGLCALSNFYIPPNTSIDITSSDLICAPSPGTFFFEWVEIISQPTSRLGNTYFCPFYSTSWTSIPPLCAGASITATFTNSGSSGSARYDIN